MTKTEQKLLYLGKLQLPNPIWTIFGMIHDDFPDEKLGQCDCGTFYPAPIPNQNLYQEEKHSNQTSKTHWECLALKNG